MTENSRIVNWNELRGLIKTPEDLVIENDMSYVIEEVIEAMTSLNSKEARPYAKLISKAIRNGNIKLLGNIIENENLDEEHTNGMAVITPTKEQIVDACCDGKVFLTGTIRKCGYDPDVAMNEVITEIDSRAGSVVDGKFTKDTSKEAIAKQYKADFSKAEIKDFKIGDKVRVKTSKEEFIINEISCENKYQEIKGCNPISTFSGGELELC